MTRTLCLVGSVLALALPGCIIADGSPGGSWNAGDAGGTGLNIYLEPLFNGTASCFAAGVDTVSVTFQGNALMSASVPCNSSQGIAISYADVLPGDYTATIEGLNNGNIVFGGMGSFDVNYNQPTTYSFNLPVYSGSGTPPSMGPDGGTTTITASATLEFAFGATSSTPGLTCAEADVTNVNVVIDSGSSMSVPCHDSTSNTDSTTLTGISVGTHTFDLSVVDANNNVLYHSTLSGVNIGAGANEITANIAGATPGGLTLTWSFANGETCAAAGVSFVQYALQGPDLQSIAQGAASCAASDGSTSSITFDAQTGEPLAAGVYTLASISATDDNGNQVIAPIGPIGNIDVPAGVTVTQTVPLSQ